MANKKIYTLVICYDEDLDRVEWLEERLDMEEELPDNVSETKEVVKLKKYLKELPKVTIVGEA